MTKVTKNDHQLIILFKFMMVLFYVRAHWVTIYVNILEKQTQTWKLECYALSFIDERKLGRHDHNRLSAFHFHYYFFFFFSILSTSSSSSTYIN